MTATPETSIALDAYPLAAMQAGMLFASSYEEGTAKYLDLMTVTLRGVFDEDALRRTLAVLAARHPVLRTSFDVTGHSEPLQIVHDEVEIPLRVLDLSGLPADDAGVELASWRAEEEYRAFDWAEAPLLRVTVHLLPAEQFALSVNFHHAIIDGWSLHTLITELMHTYLAALDGPLTPAVPPVDTFRDFVDREQAAIAGGPDAGYWRKIVVDSPLCLIPRLPGYPSDAASVGGMEVVEIGHELHQRLAALAGELAVPLRSVLLAAHLRMVGLLSGESDVLSGYVTNGRPESEGGAEVLGLFVNSLPIRARLDARTWPDLIRRVYQAELAAIPHRAFPLFEIQQLAGRSPLVDSLFDFRNFHVYDGLPQDERLVMVGREHREHIDIPFGVVFTVSRDGKLWMSINYDLRHFPAAQMADVLDRYGMVLNQMVSHPEQAPADTAGLLTEVEFAQCREWNDTATDLCAPAMLHDFFLAQARLTPDAVAVVDASGEYTYEQVRRRANALAQRLQVLGAAPDHTIGIYLERGIDFAVGVLGVLMSGAAALPLDLDQPEYRLLQATSDASATLLVTTAETGESFQFKGVKVLVDEAESATTPQISVIRPDALAYVLYTSGSTGRPKGVMLPHQALTNYISWMAQRLSLTSTDRVAQRTPVGWDGSVVELFAAFAAGAASVTVPTEAVGDPATLEQIVNHYKITMAFLVPSILAVHLEAGSFGRMPTLRTVASAGETLPQHMVDGFAAQTGARLANLYGPTEAGIGVTDALTEAGLPSAVVPIGGPIPNVRIYVLDAAGQLLPVGVPGDLHVGSTQLARGYLGRARLTAERFLPDGFSGIAGARLYRTGDMVRWLPSGELEFLSRTDSQVKIRGVRVELGEVENALLDHAGVRQAVVVARTGRDGRLALAAYIVSEGEDDALVANLREHLRTRLTRAAVPGIFVVLDELPMQPNGKVDRSALPLPDTGARAEWVAPRDSVEARLSALWAETLGVDAVGIRDDFFDLGGHSLVALRLTMRLRQEFGRNIPVETVISASTVERLAVLLRKPEGEMVTTRVVTLVDSGEGTPMFIMHGLGGQVFRYGMLAKRMGGHRPIYAIPATGFNEGEEPHRSMEAMADDYAGRIRAVRPHGPYVLVGHCVGGNIAIEVARRLTALGEEVRLVAMFWTHADEPVVRGNVTNDAKLMMFALSGGKSVIDYRKLTDMSPDEQLLSVVNAASASGDLTPDASDLEQARRIFGVYRANAHAVVDYAHQPYGGDVLLLVPDGGEFEPGDVFGWDKVLTGRFESVDVPGTTGTCLDEPLVQHPAALLRDWLGRADAR